MLLQGFSGGASGKGPACQRRGCKGCRLDPWVGRIPWRGEWQPTPVFLPAESHAWRSLGSYSLWGHTESDMTAVTKHWFVLSEGEGADRWGPSALGFFGKPVMKEERKWSHSGVSSSATPWTVAHQASQSMGFSREEYWRVLPCLPARDLPHPGIKPTSPSSPALQTDYLPLSHQGSPGIGTDRAQITPKIFHLAIRFGLERNKCIKVIKEKLKKKLNYEISIVSRNSNLIPNWD